MTRFEPGPIIDVAAAAIVNADQQVLLAKRAPHRHQGDRWEFPGGKLDADETPVAALVRELQEELAITPTQFRRLLTLTHHYPDKSVRLHVFRVEAFEGVPHGNEGQPLQWVATEQLGEYEFPAANRPIVTAMQLPDTLLITPEPADREQFLGQVDAACKRGVRLLQLRAHSLPDVEYRRLAAAVHVITAQHGCQLLLNRHPEVLDGLPCEGWHLSAFNLNRCATLPPTRPRWLSASCHSPAEIAQADCLGADFLLLSPVAATPSHSEATLLGWEGFAELAARANKPCYALGGMTSADRFLSWAHGGQGVAAIRAFWSEPA